MIPWLPCTKPPVQSIVDTFGFQSPQVDMSDQTFQTFSGEAVVSTDVPYSAMHHPKFKLSKPNRTPFIDPMCPPPPAPSATESTSAPPTVRPPPPPPIVWRAFAWAHRDQ